MYKEFPFDTYGCSTVPFLNLDAPPGCSPFLDSETIKKHKVSLLGIPFWKLVGIVLLTPRCPNRKCNDSTNRSWSSENARSPSPFGPSDPPQVLFTMRRVQLDVITKLLTGVFVCEK
jgi:hypothetical protein